MALNHLPRDRGVLATSLSGKLRARAAINCPAHARSEGGGRCERNSSAEEGVALGESRAVERKADRIDDRGGRGGAAWAELEAVERWLRQGIKGEEIEVWRSDGQGPEGPPTLGERASHRRSDERRRVSRKLTLRSSEQAEHPRSRSRGLMMGRPMAGTGRLGRQGPTRMSSPQRRSREERERLTDRDANAPTQWVPEVPESSQRSPLQRWPTSRSNGLARRRPVVRRSLPNEQPRPGGARMEGDSGLATGVGSVSWSSGPWARSAGRLIPLTGGVGSSPAMASRVLLGRLPALLGELRLP